MRLDNNRNFLITTAQTTIDLHSESSKTFGKEKMEKKNSIE